MTRSRVDFEVDGEVGWDFGEVKGWLIGVGEGC